ncbi:MAG TPA: PIG-L family deacetylase, partial [Chitinophagaceae bacterium]|nr:PIG-L family deacetylase [Chitinophagaceae bacterium]
HIQQNKKIVNSKNIQLQITSNINALKTSVTISLHQANNIVYAKDTILDLKNAESYAFNIAISNLKNYTFNEVITPSVQINYQTKEQQYTQDLKNISYEHIPNLHYFFTNETKFINEKIITKPLKVGYINGAGDKVAEAIEQMGYIVTQLTEKDLNIETLKQYNAIVIGIRAYNIHEYLTDKNNVLNAFVKNGGNLIVQYIKSNSIGTKAIQSGPYSFTVNSRSRITEEDAKVKFLLPNHTVLNYPNKISSADFENWVQERSTYQAEKFDSNFECILGMNDTGEKETNSSLLIAKYGKGNYVYCSLALFRQLPAGIAGSYKLLANMLELEKH